MIRFLPSKRANGKPSRPALTPPKPSVTRARAYLAMSDEIISGLDLGDGAAVKKARKYLRNVARIGDAADLRAFLMIGHVLAQAHVRGLIDEGERVIISVSVQRQSKGA